MHQILVDVERHFLLRPILSRFFLVFVFSFAYNYALLQPVVLFQEDFDGGIPADWTLTPDCPDEAIWQWSANGKADSVFFDTSMI